MSLTEIKNKVAVVTGGVNGIGYACVYDLLKNDASYVAIFDNTLENVWLDELEDKFDKDRVEVYHCDVSNEDDFRSNYEKVLKKHKYVDILINDAGIANEKNAARLLDVNVKGTILCNLIAIEYMGKHKNGKGGIIVNVASVIGLLDCHVLPVYSASKHAIISFTRSMKENCERIGVKIFAICPGHTKTQLNAEMSEIYLGCYLDFVSKESVEKLHNYQVQSPENVSNAVIQLISEAEAGTIWVVENDEPSFQINSSDDYTKKIIDNHEAKTFFCY